MEILVEVATTIGIYHDDRPDTLDGMFTCDVVSAWWTHQEHWQIVWRGPPQPIEQGASVTWSSRGRR